MLMMYYTTVTGWMLYYCYLHFIGTFVGAAPKTVVATFGAMLQSPRTMGFWMILACLFGFVVCFFGIQNGVERITKFMMVLLLGLMVILAVHSLFLEGAEAGIRFYLVPNIDALAKLAGQCHLRRNEPGIFHPLHRNRSHADLWGLSSPWPQSPRRSGHHYGT